ncbi:hypothetical protein TSAR_016849 [Trichomalopsis sarcophagae]|uniref:Uncharacterized protein n=1 Tax=Trichomalopsis sarcophagae TaxID=543379 RepID=A0A232EHH0_9HYME|nr:hypothetical protein TSAR_016849 [Trichomalopsis sarcophagae]
MPDYSIFLAHQIGCGDGGGDNFVAIGRMALSLSVEAARASAKIMDDVVNENRPFREVLSKQMRESGDNFKRNAEQIINKIMAPDE